MFKVIIVDDEPFVREGIKAIIDWRNYGFEICGEASDGEEGLQLVKEIGPELIITDIKMPQMDGLEFIDYCKNVIGIKAQFIILSGYSDFQYAKRAMKSEVNNYFLKPIDEDELIETLIRIKGQLILEKSKVADSIYECKIKTNKIISNIVNGRKDDHLTQLQEEMFFHIKDMRTRYIQIEINLLEWLEKLGEGEIKENLHKIEIVLMESVNEENHKYLWEEHMGKYGIVLNDNILKHYENNVIEYVEGLMLKFKSFLNCLVYIYVGKEVEKLSYIKESYESCNELKNYKFINTNNICYYEKIKKVAYNYSCKEILPIDKMLEVVEKGNNKEIIKVIDEIFKEIFLQRIAPELVEANFMIYISKVISVINKRFGDIDDFIKYFEKLKYRENMEVEKIKESIIEFSLSSSKYINSINNSNSTSTIYEVEKYIKMNYKNDISLKKLGDIFYLNSVYLGKLFKKNLGVGFNDYINHIRIEEAKKLLRRTNLKLFEIADAVGYSDQNYFISKFEKITHLTPSQYKNML